MRVCGLLNHHSALLQETAALCFHCGGNKAQCGRSRTLKWPFPWICGAGSVSQRKRRSQDECRGVGPAPTTTNHSCSPPHPQLHSLLILSVCATRRRTRARNTRHIYNDLSTV